uniref:Serpentine Receptor, class H n=1 Tax=Panagrellus redivivus TaxID=6233 RepID=A0A7E4W953_PANRE
MAFILDYKWYLVHQLSWSYIFDLYLGLWKPVPFWPFYIGYSAGIFSNSKDNLAKVQLLIVVVIAVGMGFSVYVSVLHRYVQGSPFSLFYKHYSILWVRMTVYVAIFISLICILCIPLAFTLSLPTELEEALTSKFPQLIRLFELHPSIFGYDTSVLKLSNSYILLIVFVLIIVAISVTLLYFNFIRILRKNKKHLSAGTYKMQVMLFRTLFIQMFLAGAMLIFPITLCLVLTLFGFRWISSFSLVAISILGMHALADFIVLCYFIKSYREYVKSLYKKLRLKLGLTVTESHLFVRSPTTVSVVASSNSK